eukprot:TRINITY_DN27527_c0_g1_i1.p1 TRINITY_DN27527_c0_g1~~TRINITY_DN27527_c0_g1_i1.p1  ORF type:complete len:1470 (-),score=292.07 TRINITY_DN27527_c0_g1_i1:59-4468(-)
MEEGPSVHLGCQPVEGSLGARLAARGNAEQAATEGEHDANDLVPPQEDDDEDDEDDEELLDADQMQNAFRGLGREASEDVQVEEEQLEPPAKRRCEGEFLRSEVVKPLVWRDAGTTGKPPAGISITALSRGLACGRRAVAISAGELLLALAGAHPRWSLDAAVAAALKDLLRPLPLEVKPQWALHPHQAEGYCWLMARAASGIGSVLADSMGLGKTRQAIAYIYGVRAGLQMKNGASDNPRLNSAPDLRSTEVKWGRTLVLAPATLVAGDQSVWQKEFQEAATLWRESMRVWQWHGERKTDLREEVHMEKWKGPLLECFDVVVTSYESFLQNQEKFIKENWTCVVLDEAQSIKNHGSQTAIAVKQLAGAPFRLALTGSPIENSLDDIHSILQFVEPDLAGSLHDFRHRFAVGEEGQASLRKLLQSVTLRRESGDAIRMVSKEVVEVPVRMAADQAKLYSELQNAATSPEITVHKRLKELELLCTHPWCYWQRATGEDVADDTERVKTAGMPKIPVPQRFQREAKDQDIADSGKLVEVFSILRGIIARREKALVFFCRTATSELLAALMEREFGVRPGVLRGDTAQGEREKVLRNFKADFLPGEPQSHVLLLSVWVGAVGLNLPEARWVVHVERVWNPAHERQATSRVHRLTSRFPVKAYCLYTEETIEVRKREVLSFKHSLSANVIEALDAELDDEHGAAPGGEDTSKKLQQIISGDLSNCSRLDDGADFDEEEDIFPDASDDESDDTEESDGEQPEGGSKKNGRPKLCDAKARGLYPNLAKLRPPQLKPPMVGKYGDPRDQELWDWYAVQGRKEVHDKAPGMSTAALRHEQNKKPPTAQALEERRKRELLRPFTLRQSRIRDAQERKDHVVTVDLGNNVSCRLFVPEELRRHFLEEGGVLRIQPARDGEAPFPVFIPSAGRSAVDDEVGMLDLSATMVDSDGNPLRFLQVVAVRASEVEKYRMSAPFFVVMELPTCTTVQHAHYGAMKPEELGVGCSRHWLIRLAAKLQSDYVFMLDDSVRAWRGVTLVDDPNPLFGAPPGPEASFKPIPMAQVLQHFAEPNFLRDLMPKLVAMGFGRCSPEMKKARRAFCRSHIYSAYLLNISKVCGDELNFRQDLFIWEDFVFNIRAHDVVKCQRFAMMKRCFHSGGCSVQLAQTEKPFIRSAHLNRMTGQEILAEALGEPRPDPKLQKSGRGRRRKAPEPSVEAPSHAAEERPVPSDPYLLEQDPALQPEGAVCGADGSLMNSYYKRFIQAFKDAEKARADVAAPTGLKHPGLRRGETVPDGIRFWDDSQKKKRITGGSVAEERWGAGYIALPFASADVKQGSKWFNIKTWGCWRFAFVLARLQREVWRKRYAEANPDYAGPDGTPKAKARKPDDDHGSDVKKPRSRGRPSEKDKKEEEKKGTLAKFGFVSVKQEAKVEQKSSKQTSLFAFLKSSSSSSSSSSQVRRTHTEISQVKMEQVKEEQH